jgi:hypothetical protein
MVHFCHGILFEQPFARIPVALDLRDQCGSERYEALGGDWKDA